MKRAPVEEIHKRHREESSTVQNAGHKFPECNAAQLNVLKRRRDDVDALESWSVRAESAAEEEKGLKRRCVASRALGRDEARA